MEKSNYNDALRLLNEDKKRLIADLEVIEVAISALSKLSNITTTSEYAFKVVESGRKGVKIRRNYYEDIDVVVPLDYAIELTSIEQVVYALSKIGEGTIEDIAGHIVSIDTSKDYDKIFPRYRDIASGLYRAGKLSADTKRKKYKYSLKESEETKKDSFQLS